jgi:signal transduction histidine kinase
MLDMCHPDDRHRLDQAMHPAAGEARRFDVDLRIIRPDGSTRHVHSRGEPVLDEAGTVVELVGVVMDVTERKRAERALRRARERALETRFAGILAERTRLAREIHDTLLQGFTGVGLTLVAVATRVTDQPETAAALREVVALTQKTLEDARRAVWDMRSPSLDTGEFSAHLRSAAEDRIRGSGLSLEFGIEGPARPMDPEVEAVVFRVVQEGITNVVRHAAARRLRVRCTYRERRVLLSIADDGKGFAVESDFKGYGGHWGLLGMRERACQVGGRLLVRSAPGEGTRVLLLVPYAVGGGSGAQAVTHQGPQ